MVPRWYRSVPCSRYRVGTAAVYLSTHGHSGFTLKRSAQHAVQCRRVCLAVTTRCAVRAKTVLSATTQRVLVSTKRGCIECRTLDGDGHNVASIDHRKERQVSTRYNGCPTAMEQVKQFDFNESSIFGKFDLFCKRLQKLIELFTTVHQFSSLAKHNIEVSQIVHVACCMLHRPSVLEPRKAQQSGREVTPCSVVRCMLHGMPHVERRVRS